MKKKLLILMFMLGTIIAVPMLALAQGPDDNSGNGKNGDIEGDAPIDGGLSLLVAAGVGYGAKKMKDRKANKTADFNEKG